MVLLSYICKEVEPPSSSVETIVKVPAYTVQLFLLKNNFVISICSKLQEVYNNILAPQEFYRDKITFSYLTRLLFAILQKNNEKKYSI